MTQPLDLQRGGQRCRRGCQRSRYTSALVLLLLTPETGPGQSPVEVSNPKVTMSEEGGLEIGIDVENRMTVAMTTVVLQLRWEDQTMTVELSEPVYAGTSRHLEASTQVPSGVGSSLEIQLFDYAFAPMTWNDARRLLDARDAPGERSFLRQLRFSESTRDPGLRAELDATIPEQPDVSDARLWTARVLWAKCREDEGVLETLKARQEVGLLEESYSLLRGAWLVEGLSNAPLSGAMPREQRRFSDLLDAGECPIRAPAQSNAAVSPLPSDANADGTLAPFEPTESGRNGTIAIWILVASTIFLVGLLIGRRNSSG